MRHDTRRLKTDPTDYQQSLFNHGKQTAGSTDQVVTHSIWDREIMFRNRSRRSLSSAVFVAVLLGGMQLGIPSPIAAAADPTTLLANVDHPAAVAVASDGTIYFTDQNQTNNSRVRKLSPGATTADTLFDGLNGANYATLDSNGTLYVSEYRGGAVWRLPKDSTTPERLFTADSPKGIAADSAGNVYFASTSAVNKLAVGTTTPTILVSGLNNDTPEGIAVNTVGDVYWIGFQGTLNVLPSGQNTPTQLASGLGQQTAGLALDAAGNVFYALYGGIYKLPHGATTAEFSASARQPIDLEITAAGDLVYAEYGSAGGSELGALSTLRGAGAPSGGATKNDPRNIPVGENADIDWWQLPDTDADGIPDYWETNGVWVNNTKLDLAAAGASIGQKDLFVYLDYEQNNNLDPTVLDHIRQAFANSPLTPHIQLHFLDGTAIPSDRAYNIGWEQQNGHDIAHLGDAISDAARNFGFIAKGWNGDTRVPALAKYFVNLAYRATPDTTIGIAGVKGGGGWVAYNAPTLWDRIFTGQWSTDAEHFSEATNLMHEIGHTLGLDHYGNHSCANWSDSTVGDDQTNPRCNAGATDYHSVMSYAYNTLGIPEYTGAQPNRTRIDYSTDQTPWYDWSTGPTIGRLTFIPGQYGEDTTFYSRARGQGIDGTTTHEAESFDTIVRWSHPDAFDALARQRNIQGRPDFPAITGTTRFTVDTTSYTGELAAHDNAGSTIQLTIERGPQHGTFTANGTTFTYSPAASYTGEDTVVVRAQNPKVTSQPATLTFTIHNPTTTTPPAPCTGSFCPSP